MNLLEKRLSEILALKKKGYYNHIIAQALHQSKPYVDLYEGTLAKIVAELSSKVISKNAIVKASKDYSISPEIISLAVAVYSPKTKKRAPKRAQERIKQIWRLLNSGILEPDSISKNLSLSPQTVKKYLALMRYCPGREYY